MTRPVSPPSQSPERGMLLMVLGMLLVPVGDALTKSLTGTLSPVEIAFWRFSFQALALLVTMLAMRQRFVVGHAIWLLAGGLTAAATLLCLIGAFTVMPLATAIAIFFVEPLILTVLSALVLGERTGWRRYLAVLVGLCGALVVIRPGWELFGWHTLLPLLAALAFACNALVMRRLAGQVTSVSIQFWFSTVAVCALGAGLLVSGQFSLFRLSSGFDPNGPWMILVVMGLLSAFTFFVVSEAFRCAPASTLAPFQYLEIIGATLLGYLVFGDFPDLWTWVGTAIILGSGLFVFYRERTLNRRTRATGIHP